MVQLKTIVALARWVITHNVPTGQVLKNSGNAAFFPGIHVPQIELNILRRLC